MVHQIFLNPNIARKHIPQEEFGKSMLIVEDTDGALLFHPHNRAIGYGAGRRHAQRLACHAALSKEVSGPQNGNHHPLATFGNDGEFYFSLLEIEEVLRRVALREDLMIFPVVHMRLPLAYFGQKGLGIERSLRLRVHWLSHWDQITRLSGKSPKCRL